MTTCKQMIKSSVERALTKPYHSLAIVLNEFLLCYFESAFSPLDIMQVVVRMNVITILKPEGSREMFVDLRVTC